MHTIFKGMPDAYAKINGAPPYEDIHGTIYFYSVYEGTVILIEMYGIPPDLENDAGGFFGFHIHEGKECTGTEEDPFADTGMHFNPENRDHPAHAGDLPPVLSNKGNVWMAVYSGRFYPEDVVGRTVVLHGMPDDFKTQPSGNSGPKIACGEIKFWEEISS